MKKNNLSIIESKSNYDLENSVVDFFKKINEKGLIETSTMKLNHINAFNIKFPAFNEVEFMAFDVMFQECSFESFDVGGSWVKNCIFTECNFNDTGFVKVTISDSEIINSNLNKSNFANAEIFNTIFKNVSFDEANLQGTVFFDCDLRGIDFEKTKFGYTRFVRCLLDDYVKFLPGVEIAMPPDIQ